MPTNNIDVEFHVSPSVLTVAESPAYFKIISDSSFVTPKIRFVKFLLTNTPFHPVTGLVLF